MTSNSITKRILTALLSKALGIAWPMCRARYNGVMSPHTLVARFWERVGGAGETIEAFVQRLAPRFDIDVGQMMDDPA
jgi:hypothetical protein